MTNVFYVLRLVYSSRTRYIPFGSAGLVVGERYGRIIIESKHRIVRRIQGIYCSFFPRGMYSGWIWDFHQIFMHLWGG